MNIAPLSARDEPALRRELVDAIGRDFEILREVPGRHLLTGESVRADLLCFPRQHLRDRGFASGWSVVETKHIDFARDESKRLYETFWQAISYRESEFQVQGEMVRPVFSALYIPYIKADYFNVVEEAQRRRWQILKEFGVYANVGVFALYPDRWTLRFGQGRYFDSQSGLSTVPRGLKRYVGSRSLSPSSLP